MLTHRQLLSIAALVEVLASLPLILVPGAAIELLLGAGPDSVGVMIGRVLGVALLVLGIACWGARADPGGPARSGTLRAITLYNAGVGLLLVVYAATGQARGPVVWSAAVLHLALAAGFAAPPRPRNGDG